MNILKFFIRITLLFLFIMETVMAQSSMTKEELLERINQQKDNVTLEISYVEINDFELPVDVIKNIKFENVEWKNIDASNKKFVNVSFEDCQLKNINMRDMQLENVTFKNCELNNVVMNDSKINTIVFDHSKIISTDSNVHNSYRKLNAEKLIFIKSELQNISFFESKGNFNFESSELSSIAGYGLQKGSSIKISDSKIYNMNFSDSDLLFVDIKDSHIVESKINDSSIGKVILEGNTFKRFPIASEEKYGTISVTKTGEITVHGTGPVKDTYIADCVTGTDIYLGEMEFENVKVERCKVKDLTFSETKGKTMVISHVNTYELDLEAAEIDTLILKDVRIRGKIYMANAKVKNYQATNVIVDDNVRIKDKGASFKIETTH